MTKSYRKNVGIVVFNKDGKVLLCARSDQKDECWQFPQGGIEQDEDYQVAALRELYEETGIKSVELVDRIQEPVRYDFPVNFRLPFNGQEQYWFLFYFRGDDTEINFEINPQEIEFKNYKWDDISEAPKLIVQFKKKVYNKVVDCFEPRIFDFLRGKTNGI